MKVVVIIVTYNAMKWLDRCLSSIKESQWPLQCIIIDNGSVDGTQERIKEHYKQVAFIQSPTNLGFGRANNLGMKKAYEEGADYVFLMNQDTWILPDTVEKLINEIGNNNRIGIMSPMHLNGTGLALDYNFKKYIANKPELLQESVCTTEVDFVNAACWLISRACLEQVGGFSPYFHHYGEDRDYVNRLHFHGLNLTVVSNAFVYHDRPQQDSDKKQSRVKRLWKEIDYLNPNRNVPWTEVNKNGWSQIISSLGKLKLYGVWYHLKSLFYFMQQWNNIQAIKQQVLAKPKLLFLNE